MRLIHTESLELYEHGEHTKNGEPLPPYAVLSHIWLEEGPEGVKEVVYQDMKNSFLALKHGRLKPKGWSKLAHFCARARKDGWEWAWMDTCCIDKTNTGDTQEAINAMFRWYRAAAVCYAYLADVGDEVTGSDLAKYPNIPPRNSNLPLQSAGSPTTTHNPLSSTPGSSLTTISLPSPSLKYDRDVIGPRLAESRWFTRGWTLQELLAPRYLIFVDCHWHQIGTRENWAGVIESKCGIEARQLIDFQPADTFSCSLAKRLSWAARRETTIEEDETYSLLGLFGISLPLVYGEGREMAFARFQQELVRIYDDDSIFAWEVVRWKGTLGRPYTSVTFDQTNKRFAPILAPSIQFFANASNITRLPSHSDTFSMTNKGLRITGTFSTVVPACDFKLGGRCNPGCTWFDPSYTFSCLFLNSSDIIGEGPSSIKRIGIPVILNDLGSYQRCNDRLVYTYMSEQLDEGGRKFDPEYVYSDTECGHRGEKGERKQPKESCDHALLGDLMEHETITIRSEYSYQWAYAFALFPSWPKLRIEYPESKMKIVTIYEACGHPLPRGETKPSVMGYLGCRTGLLTNLGTSEVSADVLSSVKEMSLLPDSVYCIEFQIKGSPRGAFVVIVSLTRHSTLLASIQRREDVNLEMGVRDTMIENVPGITEQEIVGGTIRIQTRPLQNSALPERTPVPLDYLNYVLEVAVVRKGSRGNNAEPSNAKKRKYSSDQ